MKVELCLLEDKEKDFFISIATAAGYQVFKGNFTYFTDILQETAFNKTAPNYKNPGNGIYIFKGEGI